MRYLLFYLQPLFSRLTRQWFFLLLGATLSLLLLLLTLPTHADASDREFPPVPPGFRIGMEIEMSEETLAHIAHDFDFDEMQVLYPEKMKSTPHDFLDDYLVNSAKAFDELPNYLKASLTQGIELQNLIISSPKLQTEHQRRGLISAPPEIQFSTRPSAKNSHQPKQILNAYGQPLQTGPIALQLPPRANWQIVYDRWKALDKETKAGAVKWELLSSNKKAYMLIYFFGKKIQPKVTLPKQIRDLYNRLNWSRDNDALEFRHRDDLVINSPAEFYKDVETLSKRAGIGRKILLPNESFLAETARDKVNLARKNQADEKNDTEQSGQSRRASFHFHMSVEGQDLLKQAILLNILSLVRRLKDGIISDLTGKGDFLYSADPHNRGLIRLVNSSRLEFRTHSIPLKDELIFCIQALTRPQDEGIALIREEITKQIDDQVIDKLMRYGSKQIHDLLPFMTKETQDRLKPHLSKIYGIFQLQHKIQSNESISESDQFKILAALKGEDAYLRQQLTTAMGSNHMPAMFREHIPDLMSLNDRQIDNLILREFGRTQVWTPEIWKNFLVLLDRHKEMLDFNLWLLERRKDWPTEAWDSLADLINSTLLSNTLDLIYNVAKTQAPSWPPKFWIKTLTLFRDSNERAIKNSCAIAIANQPMWPGGAWTEVERQLNTPENRDFLLQQLLDGILRQPINNLNLLPTITKLTANKNEKIKEKAERILEKWSNRNTYTNYLFSKHPECRKLF